VNTRDLFFELIRSRVCGGELTVKKESLTDERLSELFSLAKMHDITYIVATALIENKLINKHDETYKDFISQQHLAVYRYENNDYVLGLLINLFEENGVDFIPMKGSVIKKLYPEPCMRTSCDIDLLIKEEDLEKATKILIDKGHAVRNERNNHDVSFTLAANVHLELHFRLSGEKGEDPRMLTEVWAEAQKKDGYEHYYLMSSEMFYVYHFEHMAKHFRGGGCGVRPFLDLWIMENKMPYDKDCLAEKLKKYSLKDFANAARKTANVWFLSEKGNDLTSNIEDYILRSGVYGNIENQIAFANAKKRGKIGWVLSRIFIPYEELVVRYPSLNGKRWLTPVYCVRRWFRMLFSRRSKRAMAELKRGMNLSPEVYEQARKLLDELKI